MTNKETFSLIFDKYATSAENVENSMASSPKELQSSINNVVTITQMAINWPTITHLLSVIFELEAEFEASYDRQSGKLISNKKINTEEKKSKIAKLNQECTTINNGLGKARTICLTIYDKGNQATCDEYLDQVENVLEYLIQKMEKAKMILNLISPEKPSQPNDPKQLEKLKDALLDKFNQGDISAEELKEQMSRLSAQREVFRTITGFGAI